MPLARCTQLKNDLAALIDAAWTAQFPDRGVDDEIVTRNRVDLIASTLQGRKVYIFDTAYSGGPVSRSEDQNDYTFSIWVAERFTDAGDPPEEWIEDRKYFTEWVQNTVGNARTVALLGTAYPQEVTVPTVIDESELAQNKLFMSSIVAVYREQVAA